MITGYGVINDRSPHVIADLVEIICLFEGKPVARGDAERYLDQVKGEGLITEIEAGPVDESRAEVNARWQALSEEVFGHLAYRAAAFGEWYPFEVDHDVIAARPEQSNRHRIYAALLAFSRLMMFKRQARAKFAADFERLCVEAIKVLFTGWRVYHFGVGGANRDFFGTKLKTAFRALAGVIKDVPIAQTIDVLTEHNVGDGGLDIVMMNALDDEARGCPVFFGQCAAQMNGWPEKRFEAHSVALEEYFHFFHKPGTLLFIPVCYHRTDGQWVDSAAFATILIDRVRLIHLFRKHEQANTLATSIAVLPDEITNGEIHGPPQRTKPGRRMPSVDRKKRKKFIRKSRKQAAI